MLEEEAVVRTAGERHAAGARASGPELRCPASFVDRDRAVLPEGIDPVAPCAPRDGEPCC